MLTVLNLDNAKTFQKLHRGLLHKIASHALSGRFFSFIKNFLSGMFMNTAVNCQFSHAYEISVGAFSSQLSHTHLLLYINDLLKNIGRCIVNKCR